MKSSAKTLNEIVEGLTQAHGAVSQLIHLHQDPRWFVVRDAIALTKEGCIHVATFAATKFTPVRKK